MKYGALPVFIKKIDLVCKEMMFYQYLPIKLYGDVCPIYEPRLKVFDSLVGTVCCDFIGTFGLNKYNKSYIYLTAKSGFVKPKCSYNRPGYHSDGFLTDDINYIWSDKYPTIFNTTEFKLTLDDSISLIEMEQQAFENNEYCYPENSLLRLNQFNIHKVAEVTEPSIRTFVKISFSEDKYDLIGNSHNYSLDYNWELKERKIERNIPQSHVKINKPI